ncbi:hypothetical protein M0R45_004284 [Rubus argutus]|uniref:Pentatricopeptide repeat-containing protein n=1 Tax=Rubus argutus TaxID=59490 RepID=A0AAW1YJD3_RUBAR
MHFQQLFRVVKLINILIQQQTRHYARDPFPNKVSHYLYRAKLIDSIRLRLRSNSPNSLAPLANDRLLDSFVVTQALRSAPSADSALSLNELLESNSDFTHTQNTVHALATVLAKSRRAGELKYLIEAVKAGRFRNVSLSFMNLMQWQAAIGDLEAVLQVWEEYRGSEKRVCAESYNIVMRLYAQMRKDSEAVRVFSRMIEEGALPNCRTYTVMIEHLVNSGKRKSAMEFDEVKVLLDEMRVDGLLPGRAMRLSLEQIQEAGFIKDTDEFLREMLPNEGIKNIGYCDDSSDDDEDRDEDAYEDTGGVQRMMTLLARHGHADLVDKLLSKVRMEQMRFPFSTIRLIIDFYGISKNADAALKVFRNDRNLCGPISNFNLMLLYSSLLRTLTKCGRDSDALDVLEEMVLNGICPDIQTISGLMHHFALNGDIKTVQKLFAMVRQSGVQPDAYMFKVLIQAYCKCERAALAWRAFEDLRNLNLMPDAATKELLVKSLWKEGKRREAASVEESCEETSDVLPLTMRGHIWTVSSIDLSKVFSMYSSSFPSAGE